MCCQMSFMKHALIRASGSRTAWGDRWRIATHKQVSVACPISGADAWTTDGDPGHIRGRAMLADFIAGLPDGALYAGPIPLCPLPVLRV